VKKLSKLVNDWPLPSPMQWLNSCESGSRGVLSLAHVPSSERLPPIFSLEVLLALDLQTPFAYRF